MMKIVYGSRNELLTSEVTNPKCFEGNLPSPPSLADRAKKMKDYDPDGKKALALAEKYRS